MRFKVGDKIKFLDEVGGGTVISVIDHRMVKVETDDGFEMPVMTSNLILDYRSGQHDDAHSKASHPAALFSETVVPKKPSITEINPWGKVKDAPGVYLAFEPHEQQWILTGNLDVILLNNTGYDLLFSLFLLQDDEMKGVDFSSIPAHSKMVLDNISREEIANWTSGAIQLLFHADEPKKIYMPAHIDIDIKANRFFKEGSYLQSSMLRGKSLLVNLISMQALTVASDQEAVRKYNSEMAAQQSVVKKEKPFISKYQTNVGEAIVDLHIAELVDNIAGMSSHDMFELQMNMFTKTLKSAMENEYEKITFIHGVGNGVLKNAIIKALGDYEGLENKMASIIKFGVGAIDIIIKTKSN
jgi:small basic protein